jgi:hypothetical protein
MEIKVNAKNNKITGNFTRNSNYQKSYTDLTIILSKQNHQNKGAQKTGK